MAAFKVNIENIERLAAFKVKTERLSAFKAKRRERLAAFKVKKERDCQLSK